eukprot:jgi/Mesvir1/23594/Mv25735-RA.1
MAGVDFVLCGLITVGFVAALYLWNILRPGDKLRHRNHPTVIKRRFISSALSVLFGILVVKFRGLRLDCTSSSSADPLAEPIPLARLLGFRAEKWGPVTEELLFRACLCPLLLAGGWQPVTVVFCGAVFFGCAHVHHVFGLMLQDGYSVQEAVLIVVVQVAYTTIFGWYATFLFLRSAHILAPVVAHMFCNHMGLPDFTALANHRHRKVLIAATLLGVVVFGIALEPMTRPWHFHATGNSSIYWPQPLLC